MKATEFPLMIVISTVIVMNYPSSITSQLNLIWRETHENYTSFLTTTIVSGVIIAHP